MTVITKTLQIKTKGELQMIDITEDVSKIVKESKISNGIATVFVPGSTASVTTIEYEPGLLKDFPDMLERIAPKDINYEHENMWHDGNGHSHVRASLLGPSLTVPFTNKQLTLGTWQQIVLIELDTRSRDRSLVVQIIGE
ncbi:MAG: secondary thiamine-phosphate synthase enzyme [Candidatus Nitrosomirales archaeon]|jgi:secondary thiamine-phosphate synthase enzyme